MDSLNTFSWPSKTGAAQGRGPGIRRPSIATCLNGNPNGTTDNSDKTPSRKASALDLTTTTPDSSRLSSTSTLMGIDRKASAATLIGGMDHARRPSAATLGPNGMDIRRAVPEYGPPPTMSKAPQMHEPYFILPSHNFSLHDHLKFNPGPIGPQCNCGTWQMWCLPPHLGGCGHMLVQSQMVCGKTIDEDEPHKAIAASCPGVVMKRQIRCAAYMMGLCPTCRKEAAVIQTYNNFIAPFFVPKGLTGLKLADAEDRANAAWKGHRLAFDAWVQQLRQDGLVKDIPRD